MSSQVKAVTVSVDEEFELPRWAEILKAHENEDSTITILYLETKGPGGPTRPPRR